MRSSIRSLLAAIATLTIFAPAAQALDINFIDIFWLTDNVNDSPITNPFGMEVEVDLANDTNLVRIEVVAPTQTFDMETLAPLEYEIPVALTTQFASSTDLFNAFGGGLWTFNFRGAADVLLDSFSITLNPTEVTDIIDFTNVNHLGNFEIGSSVDWVDCSGCDGSRIQGYAVELNNDIDADEFTTTDLSTSSWTPANLIDGEDYELEFLLGEYLNYGTAEQTTGLDDFTHFSGYENINIAEVTAVLVPEPGTGLLFGAGVVMMGFARRRRS